MTFSGNNHNYASDLTLKMRSVGALSGVSLVAILASWCIAGNAWAQTAAASSTPSIQATEVGTVIVTAGKRAEKLQDVPLAITALTDAQLQTAGVTDLRGILQQTPGVTLYGSQSGADASPTIRGQFDLNDTALTDGTPNVATFLDGVYIQNTNATSIALMDLSRVEVVEGPVSALYGRTAFNGAINYVSTLPTDTFKADGLVRAGEYGSYQVQGDVNGPIIAGVLRAGLAINYDTSDGAFKDSVTGVRAGGFDKKDIKGEFDFTPTSKLDISGGYYFGTDLFGQDPEVTFTPNCAGGSTICGKAVANPIQIANINPASGNTGNNVEAQFGHLKINYDLGFADVSYLGGYNLVQDKEFEDFMGLRNGLVFPLNQVGTYVPTGNTINGFQLFGEKDYTADFSQEIRMTSKQNQPFRWSFGGDFYQSKVANTTVTGLGLVGTVPAGETVNSIYCSLFNLCNTYFVTPTGAPNLNYPTEGTIGDHSYSGFLSAEYDVFQNLTTGIEYRYTTDHQVLNILYEDLDGGLGNPEPYGSFKPATFNYGNYRAYVRYKITPSTMVYISSATGTKPGGFNIQGNLPSNQAYGPEKNTTNEIGVRSAFFKDTLQINGTVFNIETSGLQAYEPVPPFFTVIGNLGGTNNTGFELSVIEKPLPGLSLNGAFTYADPTFKHGTYDYLGGIDLSSCQAEASCVGRVNNGVINLAGLQMPGTSKETFNFGIDYTHNISGDIDGFFHIDYRYNSKQYNFALSEADTSYTAATNDMNIKFGVKKGRITADLYVLNVTDNQVPLFINPNTSLSDLSKHIIGMLPTPTLFGGELAFHY